MFVDEAVIQVRAGSGGNGVVSFRREKFIPKGGPDGGDGGDGGNVILLVNPHMRTLLTFRHQSRFQAENGEPGRGKQMFGARGSDCIIQVPLGTTVQEWPSGRPVVDLIRPGQSVTIAAGGHGGRGNVHFKSSTRRAPRIATDGGRGDERELRLVQRLLADVGLVGLPNVGKSTLLRRLSNATPKVGDYAFTTLQPMLGIVPLGDHDSFVMADLPGLVEGAHQGRGLGLRFLRHIERTRLLLFLIDSASPHPREDLRVLEGELGAFSPALLARPRIVCYSRHDLAAGAALPDLGSTQVALRISAHTGEGVPDLLRALEERLRDIRGRESLALVLPDLLSDEMEESASEEADRLGPRRPARAFADEVDSGRPLGACPWPRQFFVEIASDKGEETA